MNQIKKELLFALNIKIPDQSDFNVKINPTLSVGLDPRNDLVLISESMSFTQLTFKVQKNDLIVNQLGKDGSTLLLDNKLLQGHSYLLLPGDILKIDGIVIKITKQLGIRYIENENSTEFINDIVPERLEIKKFYIRESSEGINLSLNDEKALDKTKINLSIPPLKKEKNTIPFKLPTDFRFVPYFFLCLIFDFLLSYFLISIFPQLPLRIFTLFIIQEVIALLLFKNLIGLNLIHDNFFRKFGIWFLIFFFLFFPMTISSFNKVVRPVHLYRSNFIDIHGVYYQSKSNVFGLSINAALPPELHIIPNVDHKKISLSFYHDLISESVEIKLDKTLKIDEIKQSMLLVKELKKNENVNKELTNDFLMINRTSLWDFIIHHGPFLHSINNIKNLFLYGLDSKIEGIEIGRESPLAIFRDQFLCRVIIWSQSDVYLFTFTRPKSKQLENMIIEKVLANISRNLINKEINEIGFLEMFDSLPEINWKRLLSLYQQELRKIKGSTNLGLINFYNNQLEKLSYQFSEESRNANPEIINQIELLKNYLNQQ